jgi:hypothetical protein
LNVRFSAAERRLSGSSTDRFGSEVRVRAAAAYGALLAGGLGLHLGIGVGRGRCDEIARSEATRTLTTEDERAMKALRESAKGRPLMGDFPQRRDFGLPPVRPRPSKPSANEERAERKRLVDEWEKSQVKAPAK